MRISDHTLVIYGNKVDGIPVLDAKIDVRFDWVSEAERDQILQLGFVELDQEKIERYYQQGARCFGAFHQDRLIAYLWVFFSDFEFVTMDYTIRIAPHEFYAGYDYVDPHYRGQRIHEALLSRMIAWTRENGYRFGYGSVLKDNLSSHKGVSKVAKPIHEVRVVKIGKRTLHQKVTSV